MSKQISVQDRCHLCDKVTCVNEECINLTTEEVEEIMGFSVDDQKEIVEGEKLRRPLLKKLDMSMVTALKGDNL